MIINRVFWQNLIEELWNKRNIIWLMGVRRVGKTSLCNSIDNIEYFDCERPRVRELFEDPESFLESQKGKKIVLDEIHRLTNPSEILKLAADHYKDVKIIATGSSTLGASAKFKDTLTGRKKELWLTPLLILEMDLFGSANLEHRFLFGGFPEFFVSAELPESDFREWIDAYWAKDIQELFKIEKRYSFQKFTELLLANSGGIFEATKFATACEVSRQTISNYLSVLEETLVAHVIRPFSTHKPTEIVMSPKVYGFDTGFICYAKGWRELRKEDRGFLWEHIVLNEINGQLQTRSINYWRDKKGNEVDFVIQNRVDNSFITIECKLKVMQADSSLGTNIEAFRRLYPKGDNFIVASDIDKSFERKYKEITLKFVSLQELVEKLRPIFLY